MIYTFYSYKGGVGRSMALVNIAELMYKQGLKVLMVDWDLEAPGLDRFYPQHVKPILKTPGLINMLLSYKDELVHFKPGNEQWLFPDLKNYVFDLYPQADGPGKLWLLPPGQREGNQFANYSRQVQLFDWQDFYDNWEGESYFEVLRQRFEAFADVILIDSRTGVTEMGGVCTYQLGDVVVLFCAPNEQNMAGTLQMVKNFSDPDLPDLRHGRSLKTVVVPSRIELVSETRSLNRFRKKFYEQFKTYMPPEFKVDKGFFEPFEIQYVPLYAFEELIAVNQTRDSEYRSPTLESTYKRLFNLLVSLAPEESVLKEQLLITSTLAESDLSANLTLAESLDKTILTVLYDYFKSHPGSPEMTLQALQKMITSSSKTVTTTKILERLYVLSEQDLVRLNLTLVGQVGLVWLTTSGRYVAKDL